MSEEKQLELRRILEARVLSAIVEFEAQMNNDVMVTGIKPVAIDSIAAPGKRMTVNVEVIIA